jgi:hypothetical protein
MRTRPVPREYHNAWEGLDKDLSVAAAQDLSVAAAQDLSVAPETRAEAVRLRLLEEDSNLSVAAAQDLKSALYGHDVADADGFVYRPPHGHGANILNHESSLCLVASHEEPLGYKQLPRRKPLEIEDRYPQVVYLPLEDLPHYFDDIHSAAYLSDLLGEDITNESKALQAKLFKLATTLFAGTLCCFLKWRSSLSKFAVKEELLVDASSSEASSSSWVRVDEGLEADDSGSDVTVYSDVEGVRFGVNCEIVTASSRDSGYRV